eukprot:5216351-Prymnesium_polylepis.1
MGRNASNHSGRRTPPCVVIVTTFFIIIIKNGGRVPVLGDRAGCLDVDEQCAGGAARSALALLAPP